MSRPAGPIEGYPWPEELRGHVVTPGPRPRMHGYDVEGDLAQHYRFADVSLLALLGELPSDEQREAFDTVMTFLAPLSMAEAPTHAAALARVSGAQSSRLLGAAAIALAERARSILAESEGLLGWLASPEDPLDPAHMATCEEDREAVERLRHALAIRGVRIDSLAQPLSLRGALLATLWFAGLTRPEQIEAALVIASLPCVLAEAHRHAVGAFREYPMQLPAFEYEDP